MPQNAVKLTLIATAVVVVVAVGVMFFVSRSAPPPANGPVHEQSGWRGM
jgi:hypothetical protein